MKLNDILTESQIDELGIANRIAAGFRGARAGFKASRDKRQGKKHSERIVDILRKEFMQQIGGGAEPTMQNLLSFLKNQGLDVSSVSSNSTDTGATADDTPRQRIEPTLDLDTKPSPPASTPSSSGGTVTPTPTGLTHKASPDNANQPKSSASTPGSSAFSAMANQLGGSTKPAEPPTPGANAFGAMANQLGGGSTPAAPKRTGGKVAGKVSQTPNAVRKRNSRKAKRTGGVVKEAAQLNAASIDSIIRDVVQKNYSRIRQAQAGILPPQSVDATQATRRSPEPEVVPNNIFSKPEELSTAWEEYIKAGGTITDKHKELFAKLTSVPAAPAPAPKTAATESIFYSRFLGKDI